MRKQVANNYNIEKYDNANLKQNKTPKDKKKLKELKNQVKHWKKKQYSLGENHSMNEKDN